MLLNSQGIYLDIFKFQNVDTINGNVYMTRDAGRYLWILEIKLRIRQTIVFSPDYHHFR